MWNGIHSLDRSSSSFVDSGAILVGSCRSEKSEDVAEGFDGHERQTDSNYGSRVDCHSWGEDIYTTGYGNINGAPDSADSFTDSFGGTSGATAIVAGVAAVIQSWVKGRCVNPLTPLQIRKILADSDYGTRQANVAGESIGPMPDLRKILTCSMRFRIAMWCLIERIFRMMRVISTSEKQSQFRY